MRQYKKWLWGWIAILYILSTCEAHFPQARLAPQQMTASVAIPCCGKHVQHLYGLLECYAKQTQVPIEVVISLSDVEKIGPEMIGHLQSTQWPFYLKIVQKAGPASAGQNRMAAVAQCTGDVILFQDADDLPHPQRVEIVQFIFENYEVEHLMHLYFSPKCMFIPYDLNILPIVFCTHYEEADAVHSIHQNELCFIHNGNICVSRKLAQATFWPEWFSIGEDVAYNRMIYSRSIGKVVVALPLLMYRNYLSSHL